MLEDIPSKELFELIQTLNFDEIDQLPKQQIRIILPCLVRMCLCQSLDVSERWREGRKRLLKLLMSFQEANDIRVLSEFAYADLEAEVKKELQLRSKMGAQETDSYLLAAIPHSQGLVKQFEVLELKSQMKIVLSELILLMNQVRNFGYQVNNSTGPHPSELFDSDIYLDEIIDMLYFAISEMPNSFQLYDVVDALLLTKNGVKMTCHLIANFPDSFHEICMSLINSSGSNNEEDSFYAMNRVRVLRNLCKMNPKEALLIRGEAVELCRMPNLVIMLTLDHIKQNSTTESARIEELGLQNSKSDVISFITGILLSNDDKVRTWFSQYIKTNQKKTSALSHKHGSSDSANSFTEFRHVLLNRFKAVTELVASLSQTEPQPPTRTSTESELILTEACIMLRLYCALRGVASMKFTDEETLAICRMIVCRPRHSYIGVRFVSFGLCMIIAFPQLATVDKDKDKDDDKITDWIKWLVQEESYLGKVPGMKSSFGEMILLIAIHFHSNQVSAIGELVSSTIGIKLPMRINDLNRIKNIFTQKIFTEESVTAHAIKVPVTRHLNNSVSGFLPVHCIYQLLKNRAFTKNKVSKVKDWIFKQIRNSVAPIHPIIPQLIEAYVNSIIIPNSQSNHLTNEPIPEEEIAPIFNKRVYSVEDDEQEESEDDEENDEDEDASEEDEEMDVDETDDEADQSTSSRSKLKGKDDDGDDGPEDEVASVITSQLLLLYYVLLYEDVRLNHMKSIVSMDRKVLKYSDDFIAQLPIFYLVQKTRTCQAEYGVLMPPLLRLLAFHYPHLCLVRDWLPGSVNFTLLSLKTHQNHRGSHHGGNNKNSGLVSTKREKERFLKAFKSTSKSADVSYNLVNDAFERLLHLPNEYLWPLAPDFVSKLSILLNVSVPRVVAMNAKSVWTRLNHIFPTKLWVMTVNALSQDRNDTGRNFSTAHSWSDIIQDPLIVLKCDWRVFRTPELMEITLHILSGFLSASRIVNTHYLMEKPSRNADEDKKREELKVTMQSLTESTAIQCLLECCLLKESDFPTDDGEDSEESDDQDDDKKTSSSSNSCTPSSSTPAPNLLSSLREVQGLICTHLHQCFIADVNLAKLVHFQGYKRELLPLVVAGIPSMHICLDFLPELLSQVELEKQAFAMDLCSRLCIQYPIQRFFNAAKLCLALAIAHLSALLPCSKRAHFYLSILPSLERMCQVFPPLIEEFVRLLVQLAQKNNSRAAARPTMKLFTSLDSAIPPAFSDRQPTSSSSTASSSANLLNMDWERFNSDICSKLEEEEALSLSIHKAFGMLCKLGLISKVFKEEQLA